MLFLLWRFHLRPLAVELGDALRLRPLPFLVTAFLAGSLVWLDLRGQPVLNLPGSEGERALLLAGMGLVATLGLCWTLQGLRSSSLFFATRPHGPRALGWYALGRTAGTWVGVFAVLAILGGLSMAWGLALAAGIVVCPLVAWVLVASPRSNPGESRRRRALGALPAFWASHPLLFGAPFVVFAGLVGWMLQGGAGFAWSDRPPIVGLTLRYLWPLVFGLFWAEANRHIPYHYFRLARAPFRRLLVILGVPALVQTVLALGLIAALSSSGQEFALALVLNLVATAFWFFFWMAWGPGNLFHFAVFGGVVVIGLGFQEAWVFWVIALAVGTVFAAVAWWERIREGEGESDVGN